MEARARSPISSSGMGLVSEMEAQSALTSPQSKLLPASLRDERVINWASQRSGSMASTKPVPPQSAAAQKLNKPTLAPTSHTTAPGFTNSSAMAYKTRSTADM